MKLLVYSAKKFELPFLERANKNNHHVVFTHNALDSETAHQAVGFEAISIFSGDDASLTVLEKLRDFGVKYISLRSAGYNNIHLKCAKRFGFKVANAPDYSPYAIAEHAVALLMSLNRKIILANSQVHQYNFLQDDLLGFDLNKKTVGIVGVGKIGAIMAKIMHGFGCAILANDQVQESKLVKEYDVQYVGLEELLKKSDIVSLHVPLTHDTHYLIDEVQLKSMKKNAILINTARGAVVNTKAMINALEKKKIAGYATDVYEKEKGVFFKDHSKSGDLKDELLKKLLSLDNVLLTPHQAFVTKEALSNIADITF
ncbi:MAG: 2-hydroxyacid dehydrogenase, partial [Flavobacteriales bacterium]